MSELWTLIKIQNQLTSLFIYFLFFEDRFLLHNQELSM